MALLEISDVSIQLQPEQLVGCSIDTPRPGARVESRAFAIEGWVIGRTRRAIAVEAMTAGRIRRRVRVDLPRRDVRAAYPASPDSGRSGFRLRLSAAGLEKIRFDLFAVLESQDRVPIGSLEAKYSWEAMHPGAEAVTVAIPCYNQATYLSQAIESALSQDLPRLEVVVIDDGSTDNTSAVASRYPGVRCVRQPNAGLAAARNTGIRESLGDFLVFLDADDRLLPGALSSALAAFHETPECALVSGHHRDIAIDGEVLWEWKDHPIDGPPFEMLLRRNSIPTCGAAMFRRSVFASVGTFNSAWDACADYDLYLRISREFPIRCHHRTVIEYRRHGTNMSRDPALMLEQVLAVLHAERPFVRSTPTSRRAYRDGVRFYREHFGGQLAEGLYSDFWRRDWSGVLRDAFRLLRLSPRWLWKSWKAGGVRQ
jgi:glycosyltransferase involved in cell wall biosynthesis